MNEIYNQAMTAECDYCGAVKGENCHPDCVANEVTA